MPPALNPRPWNGVAIADNGEPLIALPNALRRLVPHPYASLGAPYGPGLGPFCLRVGVVQRLLAAQDSLQRQEPQLHLAIFDAWRPVAVQAFMVNHTIEQECRSRGIEPGASSLGRDGVVADVARFWAHPSLDPHFPPPHSTGGAVDLTLAALQGLPLQMGGEIDAISTLSEPNHYAGQAKTDPQSSEALWHHQRRQLAAAMASAGFAQHPNEWWHFSYGDQLWAWSTGAARACYGRTPEELASSCSTVGRPD